MVSIPSARAARRAVQYLFAAGCVYTGWRFLGFLAWTADPGAPFVPRPAGVEAFLPIAALAGLKSLVLTGAYDFVHPAGLTILLAAMACALVFRKSFCGFVCPVGLASDLVGAAGRRAGISRAAPRLLDRLAGAVKYLFLAFFLASIFVLMDAASARQFLASPYNLTADAHLLKLFMHPSGTFLAVLGFLVLAGAVFRNAWCRWLCPYGALLGLLGLAGPCAVSHDAQGCDGCGRCRRACPMDISPGAAARSPQCVGCGQCVEACPKPGTLRLRLFTRPVPRFTALIGGTGLFAGICLLAMALGGWEASLPVAMLRSLYASVMR
ncbi:4Fe-4S binding protein [Fundidesulfovibrio terrae]|uniref:4Fe-4S binding protein n=1 Tax=Fundidesulfovibrio terrae TaxID=2922866 RepID=UPI001FAF32B6|nr:4Fe-4S binding protein [Fundidesulfovibrio terrae]